MQLLVPFLLIFVNFSADFSWSHSDVCQVQAHFSQGTRNSLTELRLESWHFKTSLSLHLVWVREMTMSVQRDIKETLPLSWTKKRSEVVRSGFFSRFCTLKTLPSLNKEVRQFFLGDKGIWSFPSVSSLSDYSTWRSWRLFCYLAFGAVQFMVPKY